MRESNAHLVQLENSQIAFGMKQKSSQMIDDAMAVTFELESHLTPTMTATINDCYNFR